MLRVLQTRSGAPDGNCTAACFASIFEVPLDEVPDPRWPADIPWREGQGKTLTPRGDRATEAAAVEFCDFVARYGVYSLNINNIAGQAGFPLGYSIGGVTNPRGIPHSVVCYNGKIEWDPDPLQDSYDVPVDIYLVFVLRDPVLAKRWVVPRPSLDQPCS